MVMRFENPGSTIFSYNYQIYLYLANIYCFYYYNKLFQIQSIPDLFTGNERKVSCDSKSSGSGTPWLSWSVVPLTGGSTWVF